MRFLLPPRRTSSPGHVIRGLTMVGQFGDRDFWVDGVSTKYSDFGYGDKDGYIDEATNTTRQVRSSTPQSLEPVFRPAGWISAMSFRENSNGSKNKIVRYLVYFGACLRIETL